MNIQIHPDTIESVRNKADILEIISGRLSLKKRGKDYIGCCPFHQEKTPSFSVSVARQVYYCFGCQAGGDVINFLMELDKLSFPEVIIELAQAYSIPVESVEPEKNLELRAQLSRHEQLHQILALAAEFYQHNLRRLDQREKLSYLTEKRQLSNEIIQAFRLGLALNDWTNLGDYLITEKGYSAELVLATGMIIPRKEGDGYYDRFRDRLMIPITDVRGRVIGFGGRSFGDEQPKYLNSPETELFDKSLTLYGIDKARAGISTNDKAIIVEGFFDVISLHQVGITHAVAALGTALNPGQVRQLAKLTTSSSIILNLDADKAGAAATTRIIGAVSGAAYRGELQLKVLELPWAKDADEFVRGSGSAEYLKLVDAAPLWLDWQLAQAVGASDLSQASDYREALAKVSVILNNLTDTVTRAYYLRRAAGLLARGDSRVAAVITDNLRRSLVLGSRPEREPVADTPPVIQSKEPQPQAAVEALLIYIYAYSPAHRLTIIDAIESMRSGFSVPLHRFLWQHILQGVVADYLDPNLAAKLKAVLADLPESDDLLSPSSHLNLNLTDLDDCLAKTIAELNRYYLQTKKNYYLLKMIESTDVKGGASKEICESFALVQKNLEILDT